MAPDVPDGRKGMDKVNEGISKFNNKDYVSAFELYREAAVKDHNASALRRLGGMYERGNAVYQNDECAYDLYVAAANAGDIDSLYILGHNFHNSIGYVKRCDGEARRLLGLALQQGWRGAEAEYKQVATANWIEKPHGVIGWRGSFEVPKFLLEADPAADQRDKDAKEAAREAEEARKERARKRAEFRIRFFRGVWWFLFRFSAIAAFVASWKACECSPSFGATDDMMLLAGWYLLTSYCLRPKYEEPGYFIVALTSCTVPFFIFESFFARIGFAWLFTLTTPFMRYNGEKLSFALITYSLLGALVGFIASPYALCYDVFEMSAWIVIAHCGLPILFFLVNLGLINNAGGLVAKGKRTPNFKATLITFVIVGAIAGYIAYEAEQGKCRQEQGADSGDCVTRVSPTFDNANTLTSYELGLKYRDGEGVPKDVVKAKHYLTAAIKEGNHDAEFELSEILYSEGDSRRGDFLFRSAERAGNPKALYKNGMRYMKAGDEAKAIAILEKLANNGCVPAMLTLGDYYSVETGIFGGMRDREKAVRFLKMAVGAGSAEAVLKLNDLK